MTTFEIELNMEKIIAESREVAQAFNEFADDMERIEKKYAESQEIEEKSCSNCKYWLLDENDENRKCKYCLDMDKWAPEKED